jgi:hypothetical protein
MDEQEARDHVIRLLTEWEAQRVVVEAAGRRARGLATIIRGYVEMYPELRTLVGPMESTFSVATVDVEDTPRGAEAVRLILQERPDHWWLVSELVYELKERDWLPDSDNPANAVRTALERLLVSETSDVHKRRNVKNKVIYAYLPDEAPDPPDQAPDPSSNPPSQPPSYDYGEEPF